jgi:signal transduction histidine kinase
MMKTSDRNTKNPSNRDHFWLTLRFHFALWIAGMLLFVLFSFSIFVYFSLRKSLLTTVDDSLRLSASQAIAAVNFENGAINFSDSIPEGNATTDLEERGLTIRILNTRGGTIQAAGPFRNLPLETKNLNSYQSKQQYFVTITDPINNEPVRFYSEPIIENGTLVGFVQVAQSLGPMEDTLSRLLTAILLGAPLLVAFVGFGGYFLAARALAPIDKITLTARRISAEELSARLNLPTTYNEVERLATTFDNMLARLDEAFRRERQFTADASHELRTPLAAMQAIIGVIREEHHNTDDTDRALDDLSDEVNRLRALTENLLLLARSDSNRELVLDEVDIALLLRDLCDSLKSLAEAKDLKLITDLPEKCMVYGDRDSLVRLFVNLIDNAIKYTPSGRVKVALRPGIGHFIDVVIQDTGIGIPSNELAYIFDRFYQVERSRSTNGSGLGLAIADTIARQHGGNIEVSSRVGEGSTFCVHLPRRNSSETTRNINSI